MLLQDDTCNRYEIMHFHRYKVSVIFKILVKAEILYMPLRIVSSSPFVVLAVGEKKREWFSEHDEQRLKNWKTQKANRKALVLLYPTTSTGGVATQPTSPDNCSLIHCSHYIFIPCASGSSFWFFQSLLAWHASLGNFFWQSHDVSKPAGLWIFGWSSAGVNRWENFAYFDLRCDHLLSSILLSLNTSFQPNTA